MSDGVHVLSRHSSLAEIVGRPVTATSQDSGYSGSSRSTIHSCHSFRDRLLALVEDVKGVRRNRLLALEDVEWGRSDLPRSALIYLNSASRPSNICSSRGLARGVHHDGSCKNLRLEGAEAGGQAVSRPTRGRPRPGSSPRTAPLRLERVFWSPKDTWPTLSPT